MCRRWLMQQLLDSFDVQRIRVVGQSGNAGRQAACRRLAGAPAVRIAPSGGQRRRRPVATWCTRCSRSGTGASASSANATALGLAAGRPRSSPPAIASSSARARGLPPVRGASARHATEAVSPCRRAAQNFALVAAACGGARSRIAGSNAPDRARPGAAQARILKEHCRRAEVADAACGLAAPSDGHSRRAGQQPTPRLASSPRQLILKGALVTSARVRALAQPDGTHDGSFTRMMARSTSSAGRRVRQAGRRAGKWASDVHIANRPCKLAWLHMNAHH